MSGILKPIKVVEAAGGYTSTKPSTVVSTNEHVKEVSVVRSSQLIDVRKPILVHSVSYYA